MIDFSTCPPIKMKKRAVSENDVEEHLRMKVKARGGVAYKFTSPNRRSVPDRLCLMPGGRVFCVEAKRPGQKATDSQLREHNKLRVLGFQVDVVDSKEAVNALWWLF